MIEVKQLIEKHKELLSSITTTKRTYQQWLEIDKEVSQIARDSKKNKSDIIKEIAVILKKEPESYLRIFKSSVSNAKKALGLSRQVQRKSSKTSTITRNAVVTFLLSLDDNDFNNLIEEIEDKRSAAKKAA